MKLNFYSTEINQKIAISLGLIVALILVFYLGYVYGGRDLKESRLQPNVTTILANGNRENSLSQIRIRDIYGSANTKDKQVFGKFYYIVKDDGNNPYTDLLFKLDSAPLKVTNSETRTTIDTPTDVNIDLAYRSNDGQSFDYNNIGQAKLSSSDSKTLKLDFSAVLDFALDQKQGKPLERIVFRPTNTDQSNVYIDRNTNLPLKVRGDSSSGISGEPAPFFWVEI
jgi:hypothetical protein